MELKEVLQEFEERLNQAKHLIAIRKSGEFIIAIKGNDLNYVCKLSNSNIFTTFDEEVERVDVTVVGERDALLKLVFGQEPLRKLLKSQELTAEGRYSAVLKAETIFYLNQFENNRQPKNTIKK